MAGVNKAILVGNLGKDPEVRYLEDRTPVASFTLATTETYKDREGQRQSHTEWHNIVLWRGLAQVAEKYLKKGSSVYVEGRIRSRSYQDKDNQTRYITEIVADNMTMLGGRGEGGNGGAAESGYATNSSNSGAATTKGTSSVASNDEPDDLPF